MGIVDEKRGTLRPLKTAGISLKNVLFATDFSATSEAALPYAAAVCRRFGSTLHAAHVLSDTNLLLMTGGVDYVSMGTIYEDALTEAKERIEQVATHLESIPYRSYVRHGQVWKNLADIIEESGIDLIVVGTHGRTGLGKLLLGSVAEDILRHAPCPVLTVGPKIEGSAKLAPFPAKGRDLAPPELAIRQILYTTNFARTSLAVAPFAIELAEEFQARLALMHVIEDYTQLGSRPGPIEDGIRRLQDLVPRTAALHYKPECILEFGDAAKCILNAAEERQADLLVLGARSAEESVGATHLPWSTTHQVVAHAKSPVLTVRT
jgi:nucleotide-binding universal stress UspA family protein